MPSAEQEYTAARLGCVFHVFAADLLDLNVIHLSEGWEEQAAFDRLDTSEPFLKALREVMENVRILDRQGQKYEIASQGAGGPSRRH
ncbi:hypothetical protein [Streptomyces spinosirectus]